MLNRHKMNKTLLCLLQFSILLFLIGCTSSTDTPKKEVRTYQIPKENLQDLVKYVNPFIGTGGHGHTYPGATAPFGMIQVSPDTRLDGWDGCSAYHYSDSLLYGFSHTHLSGTGVSDYGDVLLMPTVGVVTLNNGVDGERGYRSAFSHYRESAKPGVYDVHLTSYDIDVSVTAKRRTTYHQYTFPKTADANIIIDLLHRDKVLEASLKVVGESEIEGYRISEAWAKEQHVYFVIQFSKPFKQFGLALDETIKIGAEELKGTNVKGYVKFDANIEGSDNEVIMAKVGISAVSIEGARKNLEEEMPHKTRGADRGFDWSLGKFMDETQAEWQQQLNKIQIEGGTEDQKAIFYTALYHTMLAPNLYTDVDGKYRGMDNQIHTAEGFDRYTVFSLWDTYRAANPLYTLIEPERTNDFIRTFLSQYREGGILPIWELASNYTGCMIGYHAIPVIADAYRKGIRDYDVELAFEAMKHSAEQNHLGLDAYKTLGYIPAEAESESVSKTLEYAYDDWCIAQMAKDLGKMDDYEYFLERSQSYKNVFDPSTKFMRAKLNQTWWQPFEPSEVNFNYTEANAWQYSYYVPQDIAGWIQLLGGKEVLEARLDAIFAAESETSGRHQADITGLIGQYAHGNEPSHHIAYLYNYVGKPWKTQEKVRQIMHEMYHNKPNGLSGNEDCGQMSAWYVWSAMGLYPVTPAQNVYAIGSPLFDKATINLPNGKQFVIEAKNNSRKNKYIQRATFNDQVFTASFLRHENMVKGGVLVFEMGDTPNEKWGSGRQDVPISAISEHLIVPVPFVAKGNRTFMESTTVELGTVLGNDAIHYTLDGSEPTMESPVYQESISIEETTTLKFFAAKKNGKRSQTLEAKFFKIPENRSIELFTEYAPQYSGGGDLALIDFIRAPSDFRTGSWQGYEGVDMEAVVDLGKKQDIKRLILGCLRDQNSWIFLPTSVTFWISDDGKNFEEVKTVKTAAIPVEMLEGSEVKDYEAEVNQSARYVKVVAKNRGDVPYWHKGAGGKCWVFVDELVIE